jgi:hypothetical protein
MIYISNALYLSQVDLGGTVDKPLIGWKSVLRLQDISSAYGENAGIMWSPDTYTYWESDAVTVSEGNPEVYVDFVNPNNAPVDYAGIAGHNFFDNESGAPFSYQWQHSFDGSTWLNLTQQRNTIDNGAVMDYFTSTTAPNLRLYIAGIPGSEMVVRIAHIRIGAIVRLQRKMYVGISPFRLDKRVEKMVTVSDSGKYLGGIAKSTVNLYTINQLDNTPEFVREEIDDFLDHAEFLSPSWNNGPDGTFFAAWRPNEYPEEVLYCHPPENIQRPVNQRNNGMMQWTISGEAEA